MKSPIETFTRNLKYDLPAGLVVFLVALPLCLGIALASNAPLLSGLITGIVGGLLVSFLSGSNLAVSGPAAGLTVIVVNGIDDIGSFEGFLVAVIIAGIIQFVAGIARAGIIGLYFPSSVIRGMLAAIGLILILKQIPHFLGVDSDFFGDVAFNQPDGKNTFTEIIYALFNYGPGPVIIGSVSLALMIVWELPATKRIPYLGTIPGALLAVLAGTLGNLLLRNAAPDIAITPEHLVSIPVFESVNEASNLIKFPDFSFLTNSTVWVVAVTIAIVASLETLLSVEATDKLDPEKHRTPKNRELRAQGIGNMVSGLMGGLPMTAVIVRSSANIASGGKTRYAAFFHGVFLATTVVLVPDVLNMIPLSSLAAVLLVVGFKLTRPALYVSQWKIGSEQFIPFITTILAILFTDLLVGICIGLVVGIYYVLLANHDTAYFFKTEDFRKPVIKMHLSEHVSFLNKANIIAALDTIPPNSRVQIVGHNTSFIDYDVLESILNFMEGEAIEKNIEIELVNVPEHGVLSQSKAIKSKNRKALKAIMDSYNGEKDEKVNV